MSYLIRIAQPSDAESMLQIYAPFIRETTTSLEKDVPSISEFRERIANVLITAPWISCTYNNTLVGYAYATKYRSRHAYQWTREVSVYIAPAHFGKSIGKALYLTLFDLLKMQGFANCVAIIGGDNPGSHVFHEKIGFKLVGTFNNVGFKHDAFRSTKAYELFIQEEGFIPGNLRTVDEISQQTEFAPVMSKYLDLIQ